jgi:hypothetical protein
MIRAASARSLGYDTLESINRTGKLPGFAEGGRIRRSPSNEPAISPRGAGFTSQDMNGLRSIIGEAVSAGISAMPEVALYAGIDPVEMFQRAIGSPSGQKALFAALSANPSKMRAASGGR